MESGAQHAQLQHPWSCAKAHYAGAKGSISAQRRIEGVRTLNSIGKEAMQRQCEQPLISQLGHCRSQCKTPAGSCRAVSHHVPSADMAGPLRSQAEVRKSSPKARACFRSEGPDGRWGCLARLHSAQRPKAPTEQQKHEITCKTNTAKAFQQA